MWTINIGLAVPGQYEPMPFGVAYSAMIRAVGHAPCNLTQAQSNTEPTLVARFSQPARANLGDVYKLAEELGQDCIAVLDYDGTGYLVGPRAKEWGEFNPAYFHTV